MNEQNSKEESRTDWARIDTMTDDEIDTSDIPELDDQFFANAVVWQPKSQRTVGLVVEKEVVDWFEEQGPNYKIRMSAALKEYADSHR